MRKQVMKGVKFSSVLLASMVVCNCSTFPREVERCMIDNPNGAVCLKGNKDYDKPISEMVNYYCTSPDDYMRIREWIKRSLERLNR